jgi:3-hydroxyisobutyrate dehydrogenase-like beta-hydroxyacid dehydrogenase
MPKVAFLGLGPMGATIGRRLIGTGNQLVVWNRTQERTEQFRLASAIARASAEAAPAPIS